MPALPLLWPPSTLVSSWHYVVNECNQVFKQNIFTIIFNKPYFRPSDETFSNLGIRMRYGGLRQLGSSNGI